MELVQWLSHEGDDGQLIVVTDYAPNYATLTARLTEASSRTSVCSLTKPVRLEDLEALLRQK